MKFITQNSVSSSYSYTEDPLFPASNLANEWPKSLWKSTGETGTACITVDESADSLAIFNTNAITVNVSIIPETTGLNNLANNGDFEAWTVGEPDSWTIGSDVTTTEVGGRVGGSACEITTAGADRKIRQSMSVVAGDSYRLEFYYKNTALDSLGFNVYDATNTAYVIAEEMPSSTSWSDKISVSFVVPSGCIEIMFEFYPYVIGDIVVIDDVAWVKATESTLYTLKECSTYWELITDSGASYYQLWADYDTPQIGEHTISLDFTGAAGEDVYAGVVCAGITQMFNNPRFGMKEGCKDYSIINEFKYGGVYINKRDVVRTYQGTLDITRDASLMLFMYTILQEVGSGSLPMLILNEGNVFRDALYGRFVSPPSVNHELFTHAGLSFQIEEVV